MRGVIEQPDGLEYTQEFINGHEEETLLDSVSSMSLAPITIHGQTSKRTAAHFGVRYDYGSRVLRKSDPIPEIFKSLIVRAEVHAGLAVGSIEQVLVNRYPHGAGIGWHSDAELYLTIIGVSLAQPCTIQFRTKERSERRVFEMALAPRSVYVMSGPVQSLWQHRIPATQGERYSITLRSLDH
jgi:DNA oxidative demethylase